MPSPYQGDNTAHGRQSADVASWSDSELFRSRLCSGAKHILTTFAVVDKGTEPGPKLGEGKRRRVAEEISVPAFTSTRGSAYDTNPAARSTFPLGKTALAVLPTSRSPRNRAVDLVVGRNAGDAITMEGMSTTTRDDEVVKALRVRVLPTPPTGSGMAPCGSENPLTF